MRIDFGKHIFETIFWKLLSKEERLYNETKDLHDAIEQLQEQNRDLNDENEQLKGEVAKLTNYIQQNMK